MTDDFFRARLDQMIDLQHLMALLAKRLPWDAIEARITPLLSRKNRLGYSQQLLGEEGVEELLSQTIQTAFKEQLVDISALNNVIIDSRVKSIATAH